MLNRSLIPTSAPDEALVSADWAGLTVISRSASFTPEDIVMPETGVGISFVGDRHSCWRIGGGETRTSPLAPGSVFVFAGEDFTWAENTTPYAGVALGFDLDLLRRTAERAGIDPGTIDLRHAHFHRDERLLSIAALMDAELRAGGVGGLVYQDALATIAMIHLLRVYGGVSAADHSGPFGLTPAKLARVKELMTGRMAEPLRLEQLATAVNMSAYHFARSFKDATGQPPHKYLTALRLDRARTLLSTTNLPISEVARRVGLPNRGHFTTQFGRHFGRGPAEYRRAL